jgi:hypothetical protein
MKGRIAFFFFCIMVVNACTTAPQVTVTSEATVTMTPPPPTHTPSPTETQTPTATATELVSETAITTTIEGNPFSGEGIELKTLNEITLDPEGDDLMHMADILDQLAAEGKITVKPVTDQRGAMQLGPSADGKPDLTIRPDTIPGTRGWQTMFAINDYDFRTFRWQDVTTRPVLIGFNNADGGVVFATMMVDVSGELKTVGWLLGSSGWEESNGGVEEMVNKFVNFKSNTRDYIHVPIDFASVDACVEYANDEAMRAQCEAIVANRSALRNAYEAMVRTGDVQTVLRNGKTPEGKTLLTLLGFTPAHK